MMILLIMLIWDLCKNWIEFSTIWQIHNFSFPNYTLHCKDSKILVTLRVQSINNRVNYLEASQVWTLVSWTDRKWVIPSLQEIARINFQNHQWSMVQVNKFTHYCKTNKKQYKNVFNPSWGTYTRSLCIIQSWL